MKPDGRPVVTVMEFGQSFPLDPVPSGWQHRKFWTRSPMMMSFAVKDGVPSMRFETRDSASMLFRAVDIDLTAYPMLAWRWYIELPIRSPLDERTREGHDHSARLFLRFLTDQGEKRAMSMKKPSYVGLPCPARAMSGPIGVSARWKASTEQPLIACH